MKITKVEIGEIHIPLTRPFTTALRSVSHVDDIVVKVSTDDGPCGYGEAPPTAVITGETKGSITAAIREHIGPAIIGRDMACLEEILLAIQSSMIKNTSAKAAVDMAVYDIFGKMHNAPLYQLLGGARRSFETDITISVGPVESMVADSLEAVGRGYTILKVKVGKEGLADVPRVAAIRDAVGPDVKIRVDANQGWNRTDAIRIISAMEDKGLDIELVEQPVPARDLAGLRAITQKVYTPILADEAVFSAADALEIIQTGAADLINIKLMKTGGIYNALKICAVAELHHVQCMVGCMLESKLAVSAGSHLACAKSIITMADLDGPSLCSIDPYEGGPDFDENIVTMNDLPGIGISSVPADFS